MPATPLPPKTPAHLWLDCTKATAQASGLRERIISRRRSGYLARYAFDEARDLVGVACILHQKESGYAAEAC